MLIYILIASKRLECLLKQITTDFYFFQMHITLAGKLMWMELKQKYIVLITDGEPSALSRKAFDRLKPAKEKDLTAESAFLEAGRASARGVTTSVMHITGGDEAGQGFVKKIADIGRGRVQTISTMEDLRAIIQ